LTVNLPNILTVLRILLTPLLVIFLQRGMMDFALLVFTLSAVSDGLDGLIARWLNQRTTLGAYLDPIADKLLLAVAYISLAMLQMVPGWLCVIVISRDILIVLGVAVCTITGVTLRIRPSGISKCTTAVQLVTIFLVLLDACIRVPAVWIPPMIWITAGVTTLSGLHYTYVGLNMIQEAPEGDDSLRRR
jgi:cardiolipin synthase (CMP-forming)